MKELDGITTSTLNITSGNSGSYYALDGTTSINNISAGSISTGTGYMGSSHQWNIQHTQLTPEQRLENLISSIEVLSQSMEGLRREVVVLAKEIKEEKFDKRTLKTGK